ncbi:MAG TPA: hypothetical protein VLC28_10850 [Flavitalea sp.]|nr:hypothetical protein [Flavitalea sp.]
MTGKLYISNYDKLPATAVRGEGYAGWEAIAQQIESEVTGKIEGKVNAVPRASFGSP